MSKMASSEDESFPLTSQAEVKLHAGRRNDKHLTFFSSLLMCFSALLLFPGLQVQPKGAIIECSVRWAFKSYLLSIAAGNAVKQTFTAFKVCRATI